LLTIAVWHCKKLVKLVFAAMRAINRILLIALALVACASLSSVEARSDPIHGSLFRIPADVKGRLAASHPYASSHSMSDVELIHQYLDDRQNGGGKDCAICTLVVSLIEQYAWDSSQSLSDAAKSWCTMGMVEIPALTGVCQSFINPIIEKVEQDFNSHVSPDISCQKLGSCPTGDESCTLYPVWPPPTQVRSERYDDDGKELGFKTAALPERVGIRRTRNVHEHHRQIAEITSKLLNIHSITDALIQTKLDDVAMNRMAHGEDPHPSRKGKWIPVPIPDWDQDGYSEKFTYRGLQFRGADCNPNDAAVYPGHNALQGDYDAKVDSNCNGIWGTDSQSGLAWEQALCGSTPPRGLMAIGDSATAHFSLPPSYVTPADFNKSTYSHLIEELITEADWPHCSWSTAWANSTVCPHTKLTITSIYQKMLERNRCMHRDYANLGVNGQSVSNLAPDEPVDPSNYTGNLEAIPKRFQVDGPSTVFFALIGNDICHAHSWGRYTPLDEFEQKAMEELAYLDSVLHPGSHVIIMGLVDGRVLYDTLKDATHPVGTSYSTFYDYLNCLGINPCWGWMNTNSTIRDASTARAMEYNSIYEQIIQAHQYKNFDLHYFYPDYRSYIQKWVAEGNSATDLIEPVDGFHPSQTGNVLLAQGVWEWMEQNVPEAMGDVNPNNAFIQQKFGDQGGYGY